MNKHTFLFSFLLVFSLLGVAQNPFDTNDLKKHMYTLASDRFEGRLSGSEGGEMAAEYIREEFKTAGLALLADDGFQSFTFPQGKKMGGNTYLKVNNYVPKMGIEYATYVYSQNANTKPDIVFVGYGIENDIRNDYRNVDVKGKWILMISGKPDSEKFKDFTISQSKKIDNARRKGVKGIIMVDPASRNPKDTIISKQLNSIYFNVSVLQIKRSLCDSFLVANDLQINKAIDWYSTTDTVLSRDLDVEFQYKSDIVSAESHGKNVIGLLEGSDPKLKEEYVVVGGHFDHLGVSEKNGVRNIYYGADDNASGTIGVMELAKHFAGQKERPKRSIIFITFDAEEKGLIGSNYFMKNLPQGISKSKIVAMVNLDMIGRYTDEEGLNIAGYNSSKEGESIINQLSKRTALKLSNNNKMFNSSDHVNFYVNDIPVFFFFTGLHADYHKPTDTPDKIDYGKMAEILSVAEELILDLTNRSKALKFRIIK
ncbi:M20/M25/M40 family metallo-hydrolase [Bacteroidales bacterium OttesenSCG-928-C19]|nr:M20/M25/M40 family metallo-hydrolase [Bacteroidales bacterium OttesenSCG-928-C19]